MLHQIILFKAPGPDDLPALFFQKYWHVVGADVSKKMLDVLNNNKNLESFNETHIALISKCKNPSIPKDFRSISLCNVVMKLVAKTIVNRIKLLLPGINDEE